MFDKKAKILRADISKGRNLWADKFNTLFAFANQSRFCLRLCAHNERRIYGVFLPCSCHPCENYLIYLTNLITNAMKFERTSYKETVSFDSKISLWHFKKGTDFINLVYAGGHVVDIHFG